MATVIITETKRIKVKDAPCNPVALYWINKNGGWDMFVFGFTQSEGLNVEGGEKFEAFIEDLQNAFKRSKYISKTTIPKMVLGYDNLPTEDVEGIKGLLDSPSVMMLISDPAARPLVFNQVNVDPGSFNTNETIKDFHDLEFSIELPELFSQHQ